MARNLQGHEPKADPIGKSTAGIIEEKALNGLELLEPGYWHVQDTWEKWGSKSSLNDWIRNAVNTDEGFKRYLTSLGAFRDASNGQKVEKYFWINHHRLSRYPSLPEGIERCKRLRGITPNPDDFLLYDWSIEAFKEQAEFRRGRKVLKRKFPGQFDIRIHDPRLPHALSERTALIVLEASEDLSLVAEEKAKREQDFEKSLRDHMPIKVQVGPADGTLLRPGFLISADKSHALEIARKWDQKTIFMIYNQADVLLIGANGEGQQQIGKFSSFIA